MSLQDWIAVFMIAPSSDYTTEKPNDAQPGSSG
jgi:hypothetical protein